MVSVALKVSEEFKATIDRMPWVNWSEVAREELLKRIKRDEALAKFMKIVSKSKFSEKDAKLFSDKVRKSMHKQLQEAGMI
jgi:membrane carboxypeptidase/penicillin-binding protein